MSLNLKMILQAVDRASGPTMKVTGAVGGLMNRVTALSGRMAKLTGVGSALAAGGAVAASMVVARAAWSMVKTAADAGDAALNNAQKIGLTVEAYQRLTYAAKMANLESGEFSQGIALLSSNMYAAARGGKEDAASFRALGVSVVRANGSMRSSEEVLADLADRFATMQDGPAKTALAMRLLGRSGKEMIPLLNQGGKAIRAAGDEAQRFGLVMTEDQAKAADAFNDNMDRMKGAVFGLKFGIGNALIPTLSGAVVGITAWISAHRVEVISKVSAVVKQLAISLAKVDWVAFADGVGSALVGASKLFEWIGGFSGLITGTGVAAIAGLTNGVFGLAAALGFAAGPVGWIILAVGALAGLAFVLWRNWDKVAAWFGGIWTKIKTAFSVGATAIWNALPPWLRMIFKGVAFVVKFAAGASGAAGAVAGAATASGVRPQPAVAAGSQASKVQVGIKVDQDGRVRQVTTRQQSNVLATMVRGQAQAAF